MPAVRLDPWQNIVNVSWQRQIWLFIDVGLIAGPGGASVRSAGLQIVSPRNGHAIIGENLVEQTTSTQPFPNFQFTTDPTATQFAPFVPGSNGSSPTALPYGPDDEQAFKAFIPRYAKSNNQLSLASVPFQCWVNLTALEKDHPAQTGQAVTAQIELRFIRGPFYPSTAPMTVRSISGGRPRTGPAVNGVPLSVSISGGTTIQSRAYMLPLKVDAPPTSPNPEISISSRPLCAAIQVNCSTGNFSTTINNG